MKLEAVKSFFEDPEKWQNFEYIVTSAGGTLHATNIVGFKRKRKYIKYSFCKYCGTRTHGTPFCSSCSKKYFNFDLKYPNSYKQNKSTQKLSSWDWRETTSDYANRVDRLLNGNKSSNSVWKPPSIPENNWVSNFMGEPDEKDYISKHTYNSRQEWDERRERLYKKWEERRK